MNNPNGLPKWITLKWTTPKKVSFGISNIERNAVYILTLCYIIKISSHSVLGNASFLGNIYIADSVYSARICVSWVIRN